jgi:hypothetical protein
MPVQGEGEGERLTVKGTTFSHVTHEPLLFRLRLGHGWRKLDLPAPDD